MIDPFLFSRNVILCNGAFPSNRIPLNILSQAEMIICCDGATNKLVEWGGVPSVIIGDGDSISVENRDRFASIFIQSSDQETNDQTKAANYLFEKGISEFSIIGATGDRDDHTLGNISLLIDYFKLGISSAIFTDCGVFIPVRGNAKIRTFVGQQISIFNFSSSQIMAEGLKYPVYPFKEWWQGTLNESVGDSISIYSDSPILLFLTYLPK